MIGNLSVLLVDDEADFVETLTKRLRKRGVDADCVLSAQEALARLDKQLYDVCLIDFRMPDMDGLTLLGEIKARRPETEVIMLTGYATVQSSIDALKKGAFDYLMKPTDIEDLMKKLDAACEKKRQSEEAELESQVRDIIRDPSRPRSG